MEDSNLFRVLEVDSETVTLNPILDEDGGFRDRDEPSITVTTADSDEDIAQVVSLLESGHVIAATITRSPENRFTDIEHRGGATLTKLDSRTVPYIITEYFAQKDSPSQDELHGEGLTIPLGRISEQISAQDSDGEVHLRFPSDASGHSWDDFTQGADSESVYGSFDTRDGKPTEVFIGNPDGERYWYAILFNEEQTTLARQVRAQYGYLYDDQYIPNPAWDLSHIIDTSELPDDPDENPKAIFHPDYTVHSSTIPPRFGSDTIQLIAELIFVGSQFEMTLSKQPSEHFNPDQALNATVEDITDESPDIVTTYKFYVALLTGIYDHVQNNPETDVAALIDDGTIPTPDVLYRTHLKFASQIHSLESYFEKMRQVPIEKYVVDLFSGDKPWEPEFKARFDIDGFPLMIRFVLQDLEKQLDEIKEILTVAEYIVDVEHTTSGLAYNIMAEQKAYNFAKQHEESISDHMMPGDLGGKDRSVFLTLSGRLERRYNWIDSSAMGAMGELFSSLTDELS